MTTTNIILLSLAGLAGIMVMYHFLKLIQFRKILVMVFLQLSTTFPRLSCWVLHYTMTEEEKRLMDEVFLQYIEKDLDQIKEILEDDPEAQAFIEKLEKEIELKRGKKKDK